MQYLPEYYKTSDVMQQLQGANATELQTIDSRFDDVLDQYIIGYADTAIARWESEFGITTNESLPLEQRRSILIAKLRGAGTTTVELIQSTALAYTNGDVDVIEDNANYTVKVKFVNIIGLPPHIDDLKNSIDEIIPAHLLVVWEYKYNTYNDLSQFTYAHLAQYTYGQLRESAIT